MKRDRSTCSTPRYKIEMYSPDPEPTIIKGSLFNTSSELAASNSMKNYRHQRSPREQERSPREANFKLDLSSLSLAESVGNEYVMESSKLNLPFSNRLHDSKSRTSPEYRRQQKQEELMYVCHC